MYLIGLLAANYLIHFLVCRLLKISSFHAYVQSLILSMIITLILYFISKR